MPREAVGAGGVAGEFVQAAAVGCGVEGDGAGGAGGGEEGAVGTPREVDGVVVELGGPVFGELHRKNSRSEANT